MVERVAVGARLHERSQRDKRDVAASGELVSVAVATIRGALVESDQEQTVGAERPGSS